MRSKHCNTSNNLTSKSHRYECLARWTLPGTKRQTRLPRRRRYQGIQSGGTAVMHKTMKSARNQTIKQGAKMEWKIGWGEKGKATDQHLRRISTKTEPEAR